MKKLLCILIALAMVLALAACQAKETAAEEKSGKTPVEETATETPAETETEEKEPWYIIYVNPLVGHPVLEQQVVGAKMAAEDYGINLEVIGPAASSAALVEETNAAIDNAITMGADAIITDPWDTSMNAAVERVYNAGIPFFSTSTIPENEDHYIGYIGTDNYNYGVAAADMLAEKTGGEAKVCVMMSFLEAANQQEQKRGFEETIAEKYPGIEIVVTEADGADMAKAITKFEEVFQAYPEIDTVWMLEATGGPAAAQVASEMGKDVLILDIDAVEQTIDLIASGDTWATMAQNFYKRGYESVRMAYEYLENGNADSFPRHVDSGVVLITQENVDSYEQDLMDAITYKGTDWE